MSSPESRSTIFVGHSRNDSDIFLKQLQMHLQPLERDYKIDVWYDTKIEPGSLWHEKITLAIQSTKVAILLVSASFFASDFIALHELPPLLSAAENDSVTILPVLISACTYEDTILSKFQFVNDPSEPLDCMSNGVQHKMWKQVVKNIKIAFNISNTSLTSPSLSLNSRGEENKTGTTLAYKEALSMLNNRTLNNEKRVSIIFMIADMADDLDEVGKRYVRGRLHRIHAEEPSDLIRGYIILVLGALDDLTVFSDVKTAFSQLHEKLPPNLQKRILGYIARRDL